MAGKVRARLRELGITLPDPVAPLADYVPFVRSGSLLFVSGQLPLGPEGLITGRLTAADNCEGEPPAGSMMARAIEAARLAAVNLLAHASVAAGDPDNIRRVVKLTGYVAAEPGFTRHPEVVNGASKLMGEVFGAEGRHARAAVGVPSLPRGAIVEIEGIFEVA